MVPGPTEVSDDATGVVTESVLTGLSASVVTTWAGGSVSLGNSRLGGPVGRGGVTCTGVSRGTTFNASGCPWARAVRGWGGPGVGTGRCVLGRD